MTIATIQRRAGCQGEDSNPARLAGCRPELPVGCLTPWRISYRFTTMLRRGDRGEGPSNFEARGGGRPFGQYRNTAAIPVPPGTSAEGTT